MFCVPFKASSIYAWHAEQAICYDGPLVTVGNVFTWVNNLTVLHHFTISLVNQSLQTFGNKHVLCRCPMSIVTTLGNVAVSCFCWFCLGWVCVCVTELSQMPGQGRRNFAAPQNLCCAAKVFCGATNAARVEIFQLFGSKRVMTANQRSTALPLRRCH